jgi:hypothetical protein
MERIAMSQEERDDLDWLKRARDGSITLRANIDETESAAIITEQGGQENHRERSQDCCSFRNQFA